MSKNSILFMKILGLMVVPILVASGCSVANPTPAISASQPTELTSGGSTNSSSPESQASSPIAASLDPDGPWLIYPTSAGIKAANADGSGSVLVAPTSITDMVASEPDIPSGVSPSGRLIAHRKNSPDGKGWELEIIHLPDLSKQTISPLISENNLASMETDPVQDMLLRSAIVYEGSLQWSPDGRFLAFIAALDGPSSDLYVYDTQTQKITHATSGELEVARPTWTKNYGFEIIYQVVTNFGTGAGWTANSVRAVKFDGSGDRLVYKNPNGTGPETILGISWGNVALVDHFDPRGGGLYFVYLTTGELHLLAANYLSAAMDPVNGDYIFLDGDGRLNFSPGPNPKYKQVNDLLYSNGKVYWDMHYVYFIILAEGIAGIDPFGNYVEFRGVPYLSYDNHSMCTVTYGIECDTPKGEFTIPDAYGATVYWAPDTTGFFYTLNDELNYVALGSQKSVMVDSGLLPPNPPDYRMVEFNAVWMK